MSELKFYCVLCGTPITGDESFYGSEFTCPACNARVRIPYPAGAGAGAATTPAPSAAPAQTASPSPLSEQLVATFTPVMRAYAGRLVLVAATASAAIAALVLLRNTQPWGWYIAGLCAACALIAFLSILWSCKSVRYQLSTQRLTIFTGLLSKHVDELELFRVKDVLVSQSLWQRMLNYGSVTILSTDDSTPHLTLTDIRAPLQAKELLRDAFREARRSAGIRATEFIQS